MGLIWDIIQHGQIADAQKRADTIEQRVEQLERDLRKTNETLMRLLHALEQRFGQDLDGDNKVGG